MEEVDINRLKDLAGILKELRIPFKSTMQTEKDFVKPIIEKLLHDPDVSGLSGKSLRLLSELGFNLRYEDGKQFELR
jgi:hypothetical protein